MNATDLQTQLREYVDAGTSPITVAEIRARAASRAAGAARLPAARPAPGRRGARLSLAAAGLAAAGIAGGLAASQAGGGTAAAGAGGHPAGATAPRGSHQAGTERAVLDARLLRHIATVSRAALATSGQALISYQTTGDPDYDGTGTDDIAFDGGNWSDSVSYATPGSPAQHAINEVVNGQAYDFFPVFSPTPQWVHDTGPDAVAALDIPDPRTLLAVLSPAAGFAPAGYATLDGTRVELLQATTPGNVPASELDPLIKGTPASAVTALELWVDSSGVVRQAAFTVTGTDEVRQLTKADAAKIDAEMRKLAHGGNRVKASELQAALARLGLAKMRDLTVTTAVTVQFTQIGQPQSITAPALYITVAGQG